MFFLRYLPITKIVEFLAHISQTTTDIYDSKKEIIILLTTFLHTSRLIVSTLIAVVLETVTQMTTN